jgi:hypothetical protein
MEGVRHVQIGRGVKVLVDLVDPTPVVQIKSCIEMVLVNNVVTMKPFRVMVNHVYVVNASLLSKLLMEDVWTVNLTLDYNLIGHAERTLVQLVREFNLMEPAQTAHLTKKD